MLPLSEAVITATPFSRESLFQGSTLFVSEECAIQFRHPSAWQVEPAAIEFGSDYPCLFGFAPPDWMSQAQQLGLCLGDHAIYIANATGSRRDVAQVLRIYPPFSSRNGRWFVEELTLLMEFELPLITSGDLSIVREVTIGRTYADCENGGFAGLDSSWRALVFDGAQNFAAILAVPYAPREVFELVVASLEFIARD